MRIHNRLERLSHDRRLRPVSPNGVGLILQLCPLKTVGDVLALLQEQVDAIRADEVCHPQDKARTIGYLAGIALKAIEAGNVAARIEALEAVLKQRRGNEK